MFRLGAVCCLPFFPTASHAQYWFAHDPRDYEECVEVVKQAPASPDTRASQLSECNTKFPGRRKPGGGYVFFDFMQNRHFDIAGPTPTPDELKQMDQKYIGYLAQQRREVTAAAKERRSAIDRTGAISHAIPPLTNAPAILPRNSVIKKTADRKATVCVDNSLSCNWSKLSAKVKALLAPSTKQAPH
jgi:hypothetical protein